MSRDRKNEVSGALEWSFLSSDDSTLYEPLETISSDEPETKHLEFVSARE